MPSLPVLDRDARYQALYERLQAQLGDVVRRFYRRRQASYPEQPSLVLQATTQLQSQDLGGPSTYSLGADAILYVETTIDSESPDTRVNALVGRIELALRHQPGEEPIGEGDRYHTTLGGTVQYAWIDPQEPILIQPGAGTGQAVVSVPIEMVVAGE